MSNRLYVQADEHGVLRVGDTRVMLDSVIIAFCQGHSAQSIQEQYPALTLEEVQGGIAYCLEHEHEVNAYLKKQEAVWREFKLEADKRKNPVIERLRALANEESTNAR
jgi:uncharacterized protein (DUF433 family)